MTAFNKVEAHLHAFLTSVLDKGSDQLRVAAVLPTKKELCGNR